MNTKNIFKTVGGCLIALAGLGFGVADSPLALAKPAAAFKAKITAKQAQATALKKYPGKLTGKTVLENEAGQWQYSVNVLSGKILREVMVDATSGKIADVEVTTKAKEAKEAQAEKANAKAGKAEAKCEKEDEDDEADEKK